MSRRDNAAVFPLHPGKEEHKRERKQGLCAFNEIVFCIQRGFQLLWGRWKALLATLKCLVLPAFGSTRGARTKYTTVQCKLSAKKLIQHRAIRTTGKQGGVDGLPCRSALSFLLEERCSRWRSGTRAAQRKVRGQQVSEGSNNLEKLLFRCRREWMGSSCKRGARTFGRFSPLVAGSSSVLRAGGECVGTSRQCLRLTLLLLSSPGSRAASARLSGWHGTRWAKRESHFQKVWETPY